MKLRFRRVRRLDWPSARTLADLGELTARYLLGEAGEAPTHCGPPDAETAPIRGRLAALNRAGLVTYCSQPGLVAAWGRQPAFVDAFCTQTTLRAVEAACRGAGLGFLPHAPGSVPPADAGGWLPPADIQSFYGGAGCPAEAVAALLSCWQVGAYDPVPGRADRLWQVLAGALGVTSGGGS